MKIKRKFEMLVATNRRYIIRQPASGRQIACAECGEPMLTAERAANIFGITQRRYFSDYRNRSGAFYRKRSGRGDDLPDIFG